MARTAGRSGRPWRRAQAAIRAQVRDHGAPCHLCGHPIDLALSPLHRDSFTVDHLDALALGGAPRNLDRLAPAHRSCNSRRGTVAVEAYQSSRTATSRRW